MNLDYAKVLNGYKHPYMLIMVTYGFKKIPKRILSSLF